jgi:hypothetical protein
VAEPVNLAEPERIRPDRFGITWVGFRSPTTRPVERSRSKSLHSPRTGLNRPYRESGAKPVRPSLRGESAAGSQNLDVDSTLPERFWADSGRRPRGDANGTAQGLLLGPERGDVACKSDAVHRVLLEDGFDHRINREHSTLLEFPDDFPSTSPRCGCSMLAAGPVLAAG